MNCFSFVSLSLHMTHVIITDDDREHDVQGDR